MSWVSPPNFWYTFDSHIGQSSRPLTLDHVILSLKPILWKKQQLKSKENTHGIESMIYFTNGRADPAGEERHTLRMWKRLFLELNRGQKHRVWKLKLQYTPETSTKYSTWTTVGTLYVAAECSVSAFPLLYYYSLSFLCFFARCNLPFQIQSGSQNVKSYQQ